MKLGPKYKIARRLGAPIFEKTQTQKFKLRAAAKEGAGKKKGRPPTEYGKQMIEKQKARLTYGLSEKQFKNAVRAAIEKKGGNPVPDLFIKFETRLDNVVYRATLASTRRFARQMVSHGHILVNGKKVTIPSFAVKAGDVISVREGSLKTNLVPNFDEKLKTVETPAWLNWNVEKKAVSMLRLPAIEGQELLFDLGAVIEFYKRS